MHIQYSTCFMRKINITAFNRNDFLCFCAALVEIKHNLKIIYKSSQTFGN